MKLGEAFGAVLKERRKAAGLSQEELAHRAQMHTSAISFLERGLRQPTLFMVFVLARVLEVQPSAFVHEVEVLDPSIGE